MQRRNSQFQRKVSIRIGKFCVIVIYFVKINFPYWRSRGDSEMPPSNWSVWVRTGTRFPVKLWKNVWCPSCGYRQLSTRWNCDRGVKVTTHLDLVSRLTMRPLCQMSSRQFSTQDKVDFTCLYSRWCHPIGNEFQGRFLNCKISIFSGILFLVDMPWDFATRWLFTAKCKGG
jgi:hypothetical protein